MGFGGLDVGRGRFLVARALLVARGEGVLGMDIRSAGFGGTGGNLLFFAEV